eukprot:15456233-Alexandrium_andersonii.AAC.1
MHGRGGPGWGAGGAAPPGCPPPRLAPRPLRAASCARLLPRGLRGADGGCRPRGQNGPCRGRRLR